MQNKICSVCFKDKNIKRYIEKVGKCGKCSKCGGDRNKVILISDKEFQNRLKASIRYHYSEVLYNPHWGGYYNWISLLTETNMLFLEPLIEEEQEGSMFWELNEIEAIHTRSPLHALSRTGGIVPT